ncbi:MAG: hypothetical protein II022_06200 [Muribaculaceae bacterium]|nr:hypothetical protein [Muribaculaceae bacterium]
MDINWISGFTIAVEQQGDAVVINANKEGLLSLANILTALSRETASGAQVHLDQYNSLEDGSTELIIAKND